MDEQQRHADMVAREAKRSCGDDGPTFHTWPLPGLYQAECHRRWLEERRAREEDAKP